MESHEKTKPAELNAGILRLNLQSVLDRTAEALTSMKTLWQDVVYGFRMLLKKPGFTVVAALSLALGIGANTVIFSLINTTLLRPLPFPDPDRLVMIWSVPLDAKDQLNGVMAVNYYAFQEKAQSFEAMGAIRNNVCNVGADEHGQPPERVDCENYHAVRVSDPGGQARLGTRSGGRRESGGQSGARACLISSRFWQRRFNNDRNVIGSNPARGWSGQDHHRRDAAEFLRVRRPGRFLDAGQLDAYRDAEHAIQHGRGRRA